MDWKAEPWYHGRIGTAKATSILAGENPGVYLLRDSSTSPGDYALSISGTNQVHHFFVYHREGQYQIGNKSFTNLPALIEYYQKNRLGTTVLTEYAANSTSSHAGTDQSDSESDDDGEKLHTNGRYKCGRSATVSGDWFKYTGGDQEEPGCVMISEPLTPNLNYFEYEIGSQCRKCAIGIGVGHADYPLYQMPGWNQDSVGYHADDGCLFYEQGSGEDFGPTCCAGDQMGCGIDYESAKSPDTVIVFFTKNQELIGGPVTFEIPSDGLYPIIGLWSKGESVRYLGHYRVRFRDFIPDMGTDSNLTQCHCGMGISRNEDDFEFDGDDLPPGVIKILDPMSAEYNYVECQIMAVGTEGAIGIGVGEGQYPLDQMPGWYRNGIGYHSDDGRLFHQHGRGEEFGPTCAIGDRMGCGVNFDDSESSSYISVYFTKNGKQVKNPIKMRMPSGGLYPLIGMASSGDKVRFLGFSKERCHGKPFIAKDTGLDTIRQSQSVHLQFIQSFQVCHDLCKQSGFISRATSAKIDMCAVDFRHLSSTTGLILSKVSHWLDGTIAFFEKLSSHKRSPTTKDVDQFVQCGKEAKELAKSFRVLAAWGRDVGGKLHQMQQATKEEISTAQSKKEQAQIKAVYDAEAKLEQLEDARESAEIVQFLRSSFGAMSIAPMQASMSGLSAEARRIEKQAEYEYRTAIMELEKKASEKDQTQYIGDKICLLVNVLKKLEETCEGIAQFWTTEADAFDAQGSKMNESFIKHMKNIIVPKNVSFWKEVKQEIDRYAFVISMVDRRFKVKGKVEQGSLKCITFRETGLSLNVPTTVDTRFL